MFKNAKNEYSVKTAPTDDPEALEELLNSMSDAGWELYTLHETEGKSGIQYNCIFYRDADEAEDEEAEVVDVSDFKSKMEKMLHPSGEPFEECKDIQRKIKEKHERISKVKKLLDSSPNEFERQDLNEEISKSLIELKELKNSLAQTISPDKTYEKIARNKLSIIISDELVDLVNPEKEAPLVSQTVQIRQNLANKYGYVIPAIHFTDSEAFESNEYSINVRGIPTLTGHVYPGYRMFYYGQCNIDKKPKSAIEDVDSIKGEKVFWIEEDKTKDFWEKGLSPEEVIAKNLEYIALRYVDEILDYSDINKYIEIAGSNNIFLIENIIPEFLSIGDLRYIFASLIRERVPLNDMIYIFERLNDFATDHEKENIIDELRIALSRHISQSIADEDRNIYGINLSKELISQLEQALITDVDSISIQASTIKEAVLQIHDIIKENNVDINNAAVIAPTSIRQMLFVIFDQTSPGLSVVTREEISKEYNVEVIGEIKL